MSLKTRAFLVLLVATVITAGLTIGGDIMQRRAVQLPDDISWDQARLFAEVMERVKRDYIEPMDDRELVESAIRGMVADLDRHSQYLDASEYDDIRISTSGKYSGVGIEVSTADDEIIVVAPIDNTPAQRAGVLSGDTIVAIDNVDVGKEKLLETIGMMRGVPGSHVILTIKRDGEDDLLVFNLQREHIKVASVRYETLRPDFGYVRISQFTDTTADELAGALDDMLDDIQADTGRLLSGLVIDLRNNPGGTLDAAIEVSDLFLDSGVIVSAEGRTPEARFSHDAKRGDILDGEAIVVLVNGGSASASEIVAGALQDHGRATILGTQTFGKGLVQTVMPLSKGRAIKLTTSRYFTPSGDSIHETGISPDVRVEGSADFPGSSISSKLDRERDAQLTEAIEYLRNQRVMHSSAE